MGSILTVYGGFEKLQHEAIRSSEAMFAPAKPEVHEAEKPVGAAALQTARRLSRRASEMFMGAPMPAEPKVTKSRTAGPILEINTGETPIQHKKSREPEKTQPEAPPE